jgi:uncharacterized beta-barrel protein YwiB (DUF1934 family)
MQDVQIKLVAKHSLYGQTEKTVSVYQGKGAEKVSAWYISYKEHIEGAGDVTTTLKVSEKEVTLLRQGGLQMKQQFEKGMSSHSPYVSPHGRFTMETHTRKLLVTSKQTRPQEIRIEYQLWMNEQYVGEHELTIHLDWT